MCENSLGSAKPFGVLAIGRGILIEVEMAEDFVLSLNRRDSLDEKEFAGKVNIDGSLSASSLLLSGDLGGLLGEDADISRMALWECLILGLLDGIVGVFWVLGGVCTASMAGNSPVAGRLSAESLKA